MTNTPASQSIDEKIESLLDSHAVYYIRETMQFFKNDGISPALSKNNKGDLKARQSIKQLITERELKIAKHFAFQYGLPEDEVVREIGYVKE